MAWEREERELRLVEAVLRVEAATLVVLVFSASVIHGRKDAVTRRQTQTQTQRQTHTHLKSSSNSSIDRIGWTVNWGMTVSPAGLVLMSSFVGYGPLLQRGIPLPQRR